MSDTLEREMERRIAKETIPTPTADELERMVYPEQGRWVLYLTAKDRIRALANGAADKARGLTGLPPVAWVIRMAKTVLGRSWGFVRGFSGRTLIAGALFGVFTSTGRTLLDKGIRLVGRVAYKATRIVTAPLSWLLRKVGLKRAGNWIDKSSGWLRDTVSRGYNNAKKWLSAKLPLDHWAPRMTGRLAGSYATGSLLGRILPASASAVAAPALWIGGLLFGAAAFVGAVMKGPDKKARKATKKARKAAELRAQQRTAAKHARLDAAKAAQAAAASGKPVETAQAPEPNSQVAAPAEAGNGQLSSARLTRKEGCALIVGATQHLLGSKEFATQSVPDRELELIGAVLDPMAAVLPEVVVQRVLTRYVHLAIAEGYAKMSAGKQRNELNNLLNREINKAYDGVDPKEPWMHDGRLEGDPTPLLIEWVRGGEKESAPKTDAAPAPTTAHAPATRRITARIPAKKAPAKKAPAKKTPVVK